MTVRSRLLVPAVCLLLVACGSVEGDGAATTSTTVNDPTTTSSVSATDDTSTIPETEMPNESSVVDAAVADLARRARVSEDLVEVVRVRTVEWPDASLGCPEEGFSYAQMIVDGFQVVLGVEGRVFDYHAGSDGDVFLCPSDEDDGGYEFVPTPGIDE